MQFTDLFGELGDDLEQITHDAVVGHLEYRRVFVLVDGDDHFRRPHAGEMLDRPGDPNRDVERGAHGLPRLPHLIGVRPPPRIHDRARRADRGLAPKRARELLEHLEVGRLLEAAAARDDHLRLRDVERTRRRGFDLSYDHAACGDGDGDRLRGTRLRALHGREDVGPQREHSGLRRNLYLEQRLARIDRPRYDHADAIPCEIGEISCHSYAELRRDARGEVLASCTRREDDGAIPALLRTVGERLRAGLRGILREGWVRQSDDPVGAVLAGLVGALNRSCRAYDGFDTATEPLRGRHHLMGDLAQHAIALLQHGERRHRTFASSRSSRTSSPTAPAPSPTILPALRSGGGVSATTSREPAPGCTGFTSSGFFFAAMMPLSAG